MSEVKKPAVADSKTSKEGEPAKPRPVANPRKVQAMVVSHLPLVQPVAGAAPDIYMRPNQLVEVNDDSWLKCQIDAGLVKKVKV